MIEITMTVGRADVIKTHTVTSSLIDLRDSWNSYKHLENVYSKLVASVMEAKSNTIVFSMTLLDTEDDSLTTYRTITIASNDDDSNIIEFLNTIADNYTEDELYSQITLYMFAQTVEQFIVKLDTKIKKATTNKTKKKTTKKKTTKKKTTKRT